MRGQKYQALIVVILLLTALPYSPFLSRASTIEKNPLAEIDADGDGIPDLPFRDSDGDGLSDDYEISLGFDPNDFDMDNDGISDLAEQDFWNDLINEDFVPPNMEDLYDCEGDLDGDGITNCLDPDADGDGLSDMEEMTDSDGDGIPDMYENMIDHLDPNNPDSDGDGILDMDDNEPPLPSWAEDMSKNNDWTPQPDANGISGGLEGFYPLAVLAAVKFTVECDNCGDPTSNPQYWRTAAKDIYDNGYDAATGEYTRSQWCPAPGCEPYGIESGITVPYPGYWTTGSSPYNYDYLVTHPDISSQTFDYTMTWIMPVQGYLSTALYTNSVFISSPVTMDTAFNLKLDGYAQSYSFTMTEYQIPESVKRAANAPTEFSPQLVQLPDFPIRDGPNNDVYDLAASITAGKTTDYDKAEAIMYYLRNNYYYNINGTLTPDGDDFVDYFLFGNPTDDGKCTNFASAFTVLSRLNGIPTRYVEGNGPGDVITPEGWQSSGYGESTGFTIQENTRVVTMLNGHAYAEVLLDGLGWVTFEPTSSNQCPTCDMNAGGTTGEDDTVIGNGTQPGTDYQISDSDEDGLSDEYENGIGTDPFNPDSDGDTFPDGAETNTGIYIDSFDTGTDPTKSDTDNDGLSDNDEILCRLYTITGKFCSHPLDSDSDNDGLLDGEEHGIYGTSPIDNDSDDDNLPDGLEIGISEDIWSYPYNLLECKNKEGDPLTNCNEEWQPDEDPNSTTNPLITDSDGDGLLDGEEDENNNGKRDGTETAADLNDTDGGGQSDYREKIVDGTDPNDSEDDINDSDGDGLSDPVEIDIGTNITLKDSDYDGLSDYDEFIVHQTDPMKNDTDGDGLLDGEELSGLITCNWQSPITGLYCDYNEDGIVDELDGTDPNKEDTDGGGTWDGLEINDGTNPTNNETDDIDPGNRDSDGDGIINSEEDVNLDGILDVGETDPNNPDTDGDNLTDGQEVYTYKSDPNKKDTDDDGLEDGDEINIYDTNLTNPDTDNDNLTDGQEVFAYFTDPKNEDSDGDTLEDGNEIFIHLTNANNNDTDDDGLLDGTELNLHDTNPNKNDTDDDGLLDGDELDDKIGSDYITNPNKNDTDDDGLEDGDEINTHGTDPTKKDTDIDYLTDKQEIMGWNSSDEEHGYGATNPLNPDSDEGGQKDGLEVNIDNTNPNEGSDDNLSAFDTDNDGLTNGEEALYGTNPSNPDTDNDGLEDGDEVNNWTSNPLLKDSDYDGMEDGNETVYPPFWDGEKYIICDPTVIDSDGDGLADGDEVHNLSGNPTKKDTDDDGLEDGDEVAYGTYLNVKDTDNDGIEDGPEVYATTNCNWESPISEISCDYNHDGIVSQLDGTNPNKNDTDDDGLEDGMEIIAYNTNPKDDDTDGDTLKDGLENNNCNYGENNNQCTDPTKSDTDDDGLSDNDEIVIYGTDPVDLDTDDDGLADGVETNTGTYVDVNDTGTDPLNDDTDSDRVNDGEEINQYNGDPFTNDTDGDNIDDYNETLYGTKLNNIDSDDDEINDYDEISNCIYGMNSTGSQCTSAINGDSDNDGLDDGEEINNYGTDPRDSDCDNDGLTDKQEVMGWNESNINHGYGATDPLDDDSDNGNVRDGTELNVDNTNPHDAGDDFVLALDEDNDGLSNGEEQIRGTNPLNPDTDGDLLPDGYEVNTVGSDPTTNDTDGDNLTDYWEHNFTFTLPNDPDSDDDGLNDGKEVNETGTDPFKPDTDDDGLWDKFELEYGGISPLDEDSDNDGLEDGAEINDYGTNPLLKDTDGDTLEDADEVNNLTSNPNKNDTDDDGLLDPDEIIQTTGIDNPDSDADGVNDGVEVYDCSYGENNNQCTNPKEEDSDSDGIDDGDEISIGSNPMKLDTDNDGLNDYWEYQRSLELRPYSPINNDTDDDGLEDGDEDLDGDGLTNLEELNIHGTNPLNSDTDEDTLGDGDEINPWEINLDGINNQDNYISDPNEKDSDGDLLDDLEEILQSNDTYNSRTDPLDDDSDNDGLSDYYEVTYYWNITGDNNTAQQYYDVQGWNTSNPNEDNTDEDNWEDGDIDEENPVYGNFEEEDPPWGSPPARGMTFDSVPPEEVYKNETFVWSLTITNSSSEEPYIGLEFNVYINETEDYGSPYYIIGTGTTNSEGFVEVICNGSSLASTIMAGDWFIRLHRPEQFIDHGGTNKRVIESWGPTQNIKIKGNTTIEINVPSTGASEGTTIITGKLLEDDNFPINNEYIGLLFNGVNYYNLTKGDGSFAIPLDLPAADNENFALKFTYNGTENVSEQSNTDFIKIIDADIELKFNQTNQNILDVDNTYTIQGSILGDELEVPGGSIIISYSGVEIDTIPVLGNHNWEINLTIPADAPWGDTFLTASYSGDAFHPAAVVVEDIIIRGTSDITIEKRTSLRTNSINLEGNVTDHNDKNVSGVSVNLFIDGTIIGDAITNSEGRYTFPVNMSQYSAGLHNISVILHTSEELMGSSSNSTVNLIVTTVLIFSEVTDCNEDNEYQFICKSMRDDTYIVKGIILDELGTPLGEISINFKSDISGNLPIFITNETGEFKFEIFVPDGQTDIFEIKITVKENSYVYEVINELEVIPQSIVILSLNAEDTHRGENVTIIGSISDENGNPLLNETMGINVAGTQYYFLTDGLGKIEFNHTLVDNYKLGKDNISATFNGTMWYLPELTKNNFTVFGTTTIQMVKVEGDWFNERLVRGGSINVTGILVDDLGNRVEGNLSVTIGSQELTTTFVSESIFSSTGTIPQTYRNNHTLQIGFSGFDFLDGTIYKSQESILVPSEIRFDFEPTNVFPGDTVNVSLWVQEDDGTPLPFSSVSAKVIMYYDNDIKMDLNLTYDIITDDNGFAKFNFTFLDNATSVTVEAYYAGGPLDAFYDTPKEAEFTATNVAISITKSPEAIEPFNMDRYIPLFIGIPAALLVTGYYLYWTQKHKYEVRNLIKQMQKDLNEDEDYRQIIIKSYHQLLNILGRYGFIKNNTQTVREFTDVMSRALPIPAQSVTLLTSLFEIARYSGIKPKVVDEFGMEMIDGSYNIWCVEAINNLHAVEMDLNQGLKEGKVSRFTNLFGMRGKK